MHGTETQRERERERKRDAHSVQFVTVFQNKWLSVVKRWWAEVKAKSERERGWSRKKPVGAECIR